MFVWYKVPKDMHWYCLVCKSVFRKIVFIFIL